MAEPQGPTSANLALGTALGLTVLLVSPFALGQLLLMAGGAVTATSARIMLALCLCLSLWLAKHVSGRWIAAGGVIAIVVLATLASWLVIDLSYDGQNYHSDAIAALAQGWNPFRSPVPTPDLVKVVGPLEVWAANYPKGAWLPSAMQAAAGLPAEGVKNQNLIVMAALFLAVLGTAFSFGLQRLQALVLATAAAANPILIVQLFTRMNDGLLGACLALMATFATLWLLRPRWWALFGVVCPLVLAVNLKFSGVPAAAGVCALICVFALVLQGWRPALRIAAVLAMAGAVGVVGLGAHPYLTNLARQGHPLYPLMGEGKLDIMTGNRPAWLQDRQPLERVAVSYFGVTASGYAGDERLKTPFTVHRSELRAAGGRDVRIAGFGPLFSGALCLGAVLAAAAWFQRPRPPPVGRLLAGAGGVLGLALLMPEAWWARYTPQVWWVVVLIALAAAISRPRLLKLSGGVLAAILLADAGLVAASSVLQVGQANLEVRRELAAFARSPTPICIHVGAAHSRIALLPKAAGEIRLVTRPLTGCQAVPLAGTDVQSFAASCPCP